MEKRKSYAVITGASSGLGVEFARRLSAEGFNIILVARRKERLEALAKELDVIGTKTIVFSADLSDLSQCRKLVEFISDKRIAIFINNAGFGICGSFLETDNEKELSMIDVNVKAVHYLTKEVLAMMNRRDYGYILNVASSAGLISAGPYMSTYYATKSYVTSLTRGIAEELRQKQSKVYVGCLCPGPVDTEFDDVADVKFSLKGISASYCANYAIDKMKKKKIVIIPTLSIKAVSLFSRFLPQKICIRMVSHQQKKKFE